MEDTALVIAEGNRIQGSAIPVRTPYTCKDREEDPAGSKRKGVSEKPGKMDAESTCRKQILHLFRSCVVYRVQAIARCKNLPHSKTNNGKRDGKIQLMAGAVITEKKHE